MQIMADFSKTYSRLKHVLVSAFFSLLLFPAASHAASFLINPAGQTVHVGDSFSVLVAVNSENITVNAASVNLYFDANKLSVQSLGYSKSLFTLWTTEPTYSNATGLIRFSGGLPSPGYNGAYGPIIRVTFVAKAEGTADITFDGGAILANDGVGTNVYTSASGATVTVLPKTKAQPQAPQATTSVPEAIATTSIPQIIEIPKELTEGDTLSLGGIGVPDAYVFIFIQKSENNPNIVEVPTDANGKFYLAFNQPVASGYYKVWARNLTPESFLGQPSNTSYVEVTSSHFITIFGMKFDYRNTIGILSAMAGAFAVIIIILLIILVRRKERKEEEERKAQTAAIHRDIEHP
jgi:hypothetical protein